MAAAICYLTRAQPPAYVRRYLAQQLRVPGELGPHPQRQLNLFYHDITPILDGAQPHIPRREPQSLHEGLTSGTPAGKNRG
jgi:hypothetical protein